MLKYAEIKDKTYNKFAEAKLKIQNRIEKHRAEEKRKLDSEGTLDVEFTNNWRESVNQTNQDDELLFEAYQKKIRQQDGDNYVLNIRTANLTGSSDSDDDAEENGEGVGEDSSEVDDDTVEGIESEESELEPSQSAEVDTVEEQEDKIPDQLKKEIEDLELTVTVEDEDGRSESLDVQLSGSQQTGSEQNEEQEETESDTEDDGEKYLLGEDAVDKIYLDVGILFAHEINENEDVQVPFQRTVLREEYNVEDIYHAEDVVQEAIDTFDAKRFDEKLEEADEEDLL